MSRDPHPILEHVRCTYWSANGTCCNSEPDATERAIISIRKRIRRNAWAYEEIEVLRNGRTFKEMNREITQLYRFAAAAYDHGSRGRAKQIAESLDAERP